MQLNKHTEKLLELIRKRHAETVGDGEVAIMAQNMDGLVLERSGTNRRSIQMVLNDDMPDLDEEVVLPSGVDHTYWESTGSKVFADHKYDGEDCVGKARHKMAIYGAGGRISKWMAQIDLLSKGKSADTFATIIEETGSIGSSVGFIPLERRTPTAEELKTYGRGQTFRAIITSWKQLESSLTCMPCNARCIGSWDGEAGAKRYNELDELIRKNKVDRWTMSGLGFPDAPEKTVVAPFRLKRPPLVVRAN